MYSGINLNISWLIETMDCSRASFAKRIGSSLSAVNSWLDGNTTPSVSSIWAICMNYGVSADFIFGFSSDPKRSNYREDDPYFCDHVPSIISIEDLTPDQRNAVHMVISAFRNANELAQEA